jgi:hypothetical protein
MKRVFILRKKVAIATLLIGLLVTSSSFTVGPVDGTMLADNNQQKKEQRVKVVVNKNGKATKIDTTFNLPDEKMVQVKVDSMLKKLDIKGIDMDMKNIVIHRRGKNMNWDSKEGDKFPENEQFDIMVQVGDSGKCKQEKRIIRIGKDGGYSTFSESDGDLLLPPPPPMPPHSAMMIRGHFGSDPFAFDSKDGSVISYEKKDIGNGLEKITIVRKKKADQVNE